jgi:hypothetical protein
MRTTVTLDDDVAVAVARVQRDENIGVSAAVNRLIRQALTREPARSRFVQQTSSGHARIDVSNVAEALDLLDDATAR